MTHARKQIRDDVKTALSGATVAGTNVVSQREFPIAESSLPAVNVFTVDEVVEIDSMSNVQGRQLRLTIEGYVSSAGAAADLDDVLDAIAEEIEIAVEGTPPTGIEEVMLEQTQFDVAGDANKLAGVVSVNYLFTYRTVEGSPATLV